MPLRLPPSPKFPGSLKNIYRDQIIKPLKCNYMLPLKLLAFGVHRCLSQWQQLKVVYTENVSGKGQYNTLDIRNTPCNQIIAYLKSALSWPEIHHLFLAIHGYDITIIQILDYTLTISHVQVCLLLLESDITFWIINGKPRNFSYANLTTIIYTQIHANFPCLKLVS